MTKVGALWQRVSKAGASYINGIIDCDKLPSIEKCNVVVFKNDRKQKESSPDFIMYLSEPKGGAKKAGASQGDFFGGSEVPPDDDTPF